MLLQLRDNRCNLITTNTSGEWHWSEKSNVIAP